MKRALLIALCLAVCFAIVTDSAMAQQKDPTNFPKDANQLTAGEKADGWKLLFDGETLNGWIPDDEACWSVDKERGIIISQNGTTHLFSEKKYKDCILSWWVCAYDVAVPKQRFGNSGVFVRGIKGKDRSFPKGFEVQVDPYDVNNPTGGVYDQDPGWLLVKDGKWVPEAFIEVHEGKWIHQKVEIRGNHLKVWVNGQQTMDWVDEKNQFPEAGQIALQNHHKTDVVLFAGIKIKELD